MSVVWVKGKIRYGILEVKICRLRFTGELYDLWRTTRPRNGEPVPCITFLTRSHTFLVLRNLEETYTIGCRTISQGQDVPFYGLRGLVQDSVPLSDLFTARGD